MGLLDQIGGMLGGGKTGEAADGGLVAVVSKLINENGGLSGLVEKLKAAGLSEQVNSWVGIGPNREVSGAQVESAIGSDKINSLAQSMGIDKTQVLAKISEYLPGIVDKLSLTGQMPPDSLVGQALEALKKNLPPAGA